MHPHVSLKNPGLHVISATISWYTPLELLSLDSLQNQHYAMSSECPPCEFPKAAIDHNHAVTADKGLTERPTAEQSAADPVSQNLQYKDFNVKTKHRVRCAYKAGS